MPLDEYRRKRDFTQTPEPSGDSPVSAAWEGWTSIPLGHRFCIQRHRATRMHWDVRLEHNGVLMSWAVPRGPSLDPSQKRLAVRTEDHPMDYGDFEGIIPSGYGMGTVMLWDVGTFEWTKESLEDPERQLKKGDVKFRLHGTKVNGEFALVKIGGRRSGDDEKAWLMIKKRDDAVVADYEAKDYDFSVRTGRSLEDIASSGGGDPREIRRVARTTKVPVPKLSVPTFKPMLASRAEKPFTRKGWFFELKYDGVRAIVAVDQGHVKVTGRSGRDETARYPEARQILRHLSAKNAVLDCEIVAMNADGISSFERLQQRINIDSTADIARAMQAVPATIVVFDILWLDGRDLTPLPLRIRNKTLHDVITSGDGVLYADHVETEGEAFFTTVSARGLEGVIAKSADSTYQAGRRSADWLKIKAWQTQSCIICGYTAGKGRRTQHLGALVLGVMDGGSLRFAGQVGTGFSAETLRTLKAELDATARPTSPIAPPPPTNEPATWVEPKLVCEVRHAGFTSGGVLRHPAFVGLRTDIEPKDCTVDPVASAPNAPAGEVAPPAEDLEESLAQLKAMTRDGMWTVGGRTLRVTNLDKVYWPDDGFTKRDLIEYYVRMSAHILPYLRDRPIGMQVFPDGIKGKSFWRKAIPSHAPQWIHRWTHASDRKSVEYVVVDDVATLAWVANNGTIDIHPWHSRIDQPEQPDWAVFDLDPFEPATFDDVRDIARLIKVALDHYGLKSALKTSGQTGLQIYVPLRRGPSYHDVRAWVETVGRNVGAARPDLITWEWAVSKRTGQIRIDYTQNIINKTLAAPYSVRPAPGAPVSAPIEWSELDNPHLRPDLWSIRDIAKRAASMADPFAIVLNCDQDLPH